LFTSRRRAVVISVPYPYSVFRIVFTVEVSFSFFR